MYEVRPKNNPHVTNHNVNFFMQSNENKLKHKVSGVNKIQQIKQLREKTQVKKERNGPKKERNGPKKERNGQKKERNESCRLKMIIQI